MYIYIYIYFILGSVSDSKCADVGQWLRVAWRNNVCRLVSFKRAVSFNDSATQDALTASEYLMAGVCV